LIGSTEYAEQHERELRDGTICYVSDTLFRLEQRLLDEGDAPERRWYRHVIYGWNIYSLYDGQPFPGLAEASGIRDAERAGAEVNRIVAALDRLTAGLAEARRAVAGRR
jgi:hypothetical protein